MFSKLACTSQCGFLIHDMVSYMVGNNIIIKVIKLSYMVVY